MPQAKDRAYGLAAALTYWVFRCRDRAKSPAMGTKTWTFLESSIQSCAEVSTCLEDYLQLLSTRLAAHLRPAELTMIVRPQQRILRVSQDGGEVIELNADQTLVFQGWRDLLERAEGDGFTEFDILELCRTKATIIQVLVRLRFEQDRLLGQDLPIEIDAEAVDAGV